MSTPSACRQAGGSDAALVRRSQKGPWAPGAGRRAPGAGRRAYLTGSYATRFGKARMMAAVRFETSSLA